jgi:integrase
MLKEAPPRSGFFEREAFEAVREHLPDYLKGLISFAYISGWRTRSEILPLRWTQVDFEAGTVRLDPGTTKSGAGRIFHFTDLMHEVLRTQRAYTDLVQRELGVVIPWVFHRNGRRISSFRKAWTRACYEAGLPCQVETEMGSDGKLHIKSIKAEALVHDLRRSAVRNFIRSGLSEAIAMKLSGHATRSVFDRYNVSSASDLKDAAEMLNQFHNVTGTKPGTVGLNREVRPPQVVDSIHVGR